MAKRLNYTIGVDADTSKFEASLMKALTSLDKLSKLKTSNAITSDLKEASLAAQQLQQSLERATNVNTGKLDLSKFSAAIQASGISLKDYANKLQAIGAQGEEAFLSVASAVAKAEVPLKRSNKLLDSLWVTMKNTVRWQLTSSALHGFVGALETAYGYTKDLDRSLNEIRIVSGKSASDMSEFAEQANKAAKALSTTTTDYTDASLIYYQQGLSDQEVLDRTETTIKMANVAGTTAETASQQLTAIWNNFYDGSQSLEHYADVMVKLGAATASSSDEISEGIEKFASIGNTVGLSYEYAASALATVTAQTRESASVVGTAFRTLFSRIQGLQQGDTLEDGTTLNKYSQALATVGVQIKDTNGNLKGMDEILDDLGSKWGTLAQDQKIALAETVAGVRQWTQLIALMDNWDFFKDNLALAQNADGTLTEQAEIYAESWQGARDRVKAAAEDIYDSLINPQFFVDVDDNITPLLTGIADVIDAMGGMKGIILTTGTVFTAVYHDQIAKGLQDIAYNFSVIIGKADIAQRKIKEDFGQAALTMVADSARSTDAEVAKKAIQAEDIEMQNFLNSQAKMLTEEQVKQLSGYKDIITSIKEMALEYQGVAQAHTQETEKLIAEGSAQANAAKSAKGYKTTLQQVSNILKGIKVPDLEFKKNEKSLEAMLRSYSKLNSTVAGINRIQVQMAALSEEDIQNTQLVEKLKAQYQELTGIDLGSSTLQQSQTKIQETITQIDEALEKLYNSLTRHGVSEDYLERLRTATTGIGEAQQNSAHATDIAANAYADYRLKVYQATVQQETWADKIVNGANHLMQLGMMIQSIKNLGSIWSDQDLSMSDKIVETLTSVGMLLPIIISAVQAYTKARVTYNAVVVEGTGAEAANALASQLTARQKIVETTAVEGNTVAVVQNTAAWYANPLTWVLAGITAIIGAFAIYNAVVDANTEKRRNNAEADVESANKAAEANKKERTTVDELYKSYIELKSVSDNSTEAKENLKQKTQELCDALGVEWDALDKLNDKYDDVNQKIMEANRLSAQKALNDSKKAVDAQKTSILENNATYDDSAAVNKYSFKFGGGAFKNDENEVTDAIQNKLKGISNVHAAESGSGLRVTLKDADDLIEVYARLSELKDEIASDDKWESVRQESEVYQNLSKWLSEVAPEYEKLTQLEQDQITYAQQLAEAEGAVAGAQLENVDTLEEYQTVKEQYVNKLKEIFTTQDIVPDDVDDIDQYFSDLADKYLSGFTNLADTVAQSKVYDAIIDKLGDNGKEKLDTLLDNGFNLNVLGKVTDWESLNGEITDYINELKELKELGYTPDTEKVGNIDLSEARGSITWNKENLAKYKDQLQSLGYNDADFKEMQDQVSTVMGKSSEYDGVEIAYTPLLKTSDGLVPLDQNTVDEYIFGLIDKSKDEFGDDWQNHLLDLDTEGLEFDGQVVKNLLADIGDTAKNTGEAMHYLGDDGSLALHQLNLETEIQAQLQERLKDLTGDGSGLDYAANIIQKLQSGDLTKDNIADDEDYKNLLQVLDVLKEAFPELEADAIEVSNVWEVGGQKFIEALTAIQQKIDELSLQKLVDDAEEASSKVEKILSSDDWEVEIGANPEKFLDAMDDLLDKNYAVDVEIHTQAEEEFDSISNAMQDIEDQASKIGEKFIVAASDVRELNNTFPGIIQGMKSLSDGTVQLNEQMVQNAIAAARTEVAADAEATVTRLQNQATLLRSKQQVYQQMAVAAAVLAGQETDSAMTSAEAQATLSGGLADLKQLNSQAATNTENDNQKKVADSSNSNAGVTAKNWNSAFASAAKSSAAFAQAAMQNMKAAAAGKGATTTGNFAVTYSGASGVSEEASVLNETKKMLDDVANTSQDAWAEASAKYQNMADAAGAAANDIEGMIAQVGATTTGLNHTLGNVAAGKGAGGGKGGKGGGGSKGKTYDKEDLKTLKDVEDRYHNINRQLERQDDLLDDLGNKTDRAWGAKALASYEDEIKALQKQQELYNQKLKEAQNYLTQDSALVKKYFSDAQIASNGEITNYEALLKKNMELYNAAVKQYNLAVDGKTITEEQHTALKNKLDAEKKLFDERADALKQYESTLDEVRDTTDNIEENMRSIADKKLEEIKLRLEIVLDVKSMKDAVRDLSKEISEIFGDTLTQNFMGYDKFDSPLALDAEAAKAEANLMPRYKQQYEELKALYDSATDDADRSAIMDEISDLQSKIADSAKSIVEWANSIEDIVPDAVDAAAERFSAFTDQLEHNTSVLDTIKELYTLQGVTYKTASGFNRLQKVSQEKLEAQVASAKLQRGWYEEAAKRLETAQANLDALNGDESDIRYDALKKARDAYLEQFNDAQEAYLSSAQEAMETAQDMYLDQIERAVYKFGQAVSNGAGLDLLQDKYDHYIEQNERYFDKVNEAYQVSAWYNKLQKDIDDTTNSAHKERLKALQEEINQRREGNKLSQYDLDILNAKYQVLQAQMALEDAQNAKNQIQLTRDSQGNWNYQYTANQDDIANAQQKLLDAENEWYNIAKQQVTDVTGEIVDTWQECQDKIKDIYSDMTLTDEERSARAQEIYQYYTEKIKSLEEEKQNAIADMTEAGNKNLIDNAILTGDTITDVTGITSEELQQIVANSGESIKDLLLKNSEQLKDIVGDNTDLIDKFDNTYAKDLDNMTQNTTNFEEQLRSLLEEAKQHFQDYQDKVQNVSSETGTTLDDLAKETDKVSESTDQLTQRGQEASEALWNQVSAAQAAADQYAALAAQIWEAVEAAKTLAAQMASDAASKSGLLYDKNTDYAALIEQGLVNGWFQYGDETFNALVAQRDEKIKGEKLQDRWDYGGEQFKDYTQGSNVGQWAQGRYDTQDEWNDALDKLKKNYGLATGGYTGTFEDAKLAFLHEKELVLNKEDTENILAAVQAVRTIGSDLFKSIEKSLDGNVVAAMNLMGQRLNPVSTMPTEGTIEQTVHIDKVEFPNVTSRSEIEEAFISLTNDAAQWARRKT